MIAPALSLAPKSGSREVVSEAQNLREFYESATSMDFFRRTVAALGGTKPEVGHMPQAESRAPQNVLQMECRTGAAPSAWKTTFRPRSDVLLQAKIGRAHCVTLCLVQVQKMAITPCAHAFCLRLGAGALAWAWQVQIDAV